MNRSVLALSLTVWLAAVSLAGGCVADLNERLTVGTRPTPTFGGGHGPGMTGAGTLDRSRWRTLVVVAPVDGVVHAETFRTEPWASRRAGPRRAGVFPFDAPRLEDAEDVPETFREFGRAAFDPVLAPLRLWRAARAGGWTWSPSQIWKRTPAARARVATVGGRRGPTERNRPDPVPSSPDRPSPDRPSPDRPSPDRPSPDRSEGAADD